jgi:hypothetical protein
VSAAIRWCLAAVLGALTALALSPVAPSAATGAEGATGAAGAGPTDGISVVARSLQSSPLYVDPDMAWMFPAAAEKQIRHALRASPVRAFVAAVPFDIDDSNADYVSYYLDQLYRATHRAGVYLAVGPDGFIYDAEYLVPRDVNLPISVESESATALQPAQIAANTPQRLLTLVHLIATATADPQQAVSPTPYYTPTPASSGSLTSGSSDTAAVVGAATLAFVFAGPLLALAGFGAAGTGRRLLAGRRGWGDNGDPGRPADHMPASPSTEWLRRHAIGELAELGRMIGAPADANPGWQRACDDYDAGKLALTSTSEGREQIDLVGAIVLARDGRLALRWRTAKPPPPCLVNPLHGRSVRVVSREAWREAEWTAPEWVAPHQVPMCARCARNIRRTRGAGPGTHLLRVEHHGKRLKYFGFTSVWRDRMFGAFGPGLPQAIRERLGVS